MSPPLSSHSQLRTIALIGKYNSRETAEALTALIADLLRRGVAVLVESGTAAHICKGVGNWRNASFDEIGAEADVAIVIGGDGTMLGAARQLASFDVPLVGVNQGRLGFMTDIARSEMLNRMDDLLEGRFVAEKRILLDAEVLRAGKEIASNVALNDVVLDKGAVGRMLELELFIDGEFVYNMRADGLIVSTPTGSTAYSLSANGPILHPSNTGIGVVPLYPHGLTHRPIVVGFQSKLELRVTSAEAPRVHFDGQVTVGLASGDIIRVRCSRHTICLLHPPGYSYFAMLRHKLHWSERPRGQ